MNTYRGTARAVGILFILATVPFSISVALLDPLLGTPEFLERLTTSPGRVALATLLELTNHIAVVAIAVTIYPVLRLFGERLAVGYVAARVIESALFLIATMHLLALLQLSGEFVAAGAPADPYFQSVGGLLFTGHDWNRVPIAFLTFSLGHIGFYRADGDFHPAA